MTCLDSSLDIIPLLYKLFIYAHVIIEILI